MRWIEAGLTAVLLGAALPGAARAPARPAATLQPLATLQELMQGEIDPAADFIWDSVGTIESTAGTEERHPRTPEEWEAVRLRAVILAEASNLLQLPGRRVAAQPFASDGPGVLSSAAIQRQLDRDRTVFNALAVALRSASLAVAAAAKAQDAGAMQRAGESLDAACEACHTVNWYPRQVIPALPPKPPEL